MSNEDSISGGRSPLLFFLLVFALSVPFWFVGAVLGIELLPGLPISAAMIVCPFAAALILLYRECGGSGVVAHLKRSFDHERIKRKGWYAPIVLLMPAVAFLSYCVMRLLDLPLPTPHVPLLMAPALFLLFFIAALSEELGWSGYAIDPLQQRWGALRASIILGVVWAAWHVVPLVQVGRAPDWIAWWCLSTVAARTLHTWLYNNTGKSVFGAAVFHAMSNVSWQMFPNSGSHYDPRVTAAIVTGIAVLVAFTCGPRTLVRATASLRG